MTLNPEGTINMRQVSLGSFDSNAVSFDPAADFRDPHCFDPASDFLFLREEPYLLSAGLEQQQDVT